MAKELTLQEKETIKQGVLEIIKLVEPLQKCTTYEEVKKSS